MVRERDPHLLELMQRCRQMKPAVRDRIRKGTFRPGSWSDEQVAELQEAMREVDDEDRRRPGKTYPY